MKKIYLLFAIALLFVSCDRDEDYGTNWKIINLEVKSTDWIRSTDNAGLNGYYFCNFKMPEITSEVYNGGTIMAYRVFDDYQQIMPFVHHKESVDENSIKYYWTETTDFDYSVGAMNVYVTYSDFYEQTPEAMNFRVVIMW